MSIEFKKIETAEEYIDLVKKLSYLVDKELTKLEKRIEKEGVSSILGARPQVISLVNTIAYLRGEDGVFLESRPDGLSEFQRDLYKNEDDFMARLHKLRKIIFESERGRKIYKNALEEYYVNRNLPQEYRG